MLEKVFQYNRDLAFKAVREQLKEAGQNIPPEEEEETISRLLATKYWYFPERSFKLREQLGTKNRLTCYALLVDQGARVRWRAMHIPEQEEINHAIAVTNALASTRQKKQDLHDFLQEKTDFFEKQTF